MMYLIHTKTNVRTEVIGCTESNVEVLHINPHYISLSSATKGRVHGHKIPEVSTGLACKIDNGYKTFKQTPFWDEPTIFFYKRVLTQYQWQKVPMILASRTRSVARILTVKRPIMPFGKARTWWRALWRKWTVGSICKHASVCKYILLIKVSCSKAHENEYNKRSNYIQSLNQVHFLKSIFASQARTFHHKVWSSQSAAGGCSEKTRKPHAWWGKEKRTRRTTEHR